MTDSEKLLMIRELNTRLDEITQQMSTLDKFNNQLQSLTKSNRLKYKKLCKRESETMKFKLELLKELEQSNDIL